MGGNANDPFSISNWKNQLNTKLENMENSITHAESKVDKTNSKYNIVESRMRKQGSKLAKLYKTLSSLKSQMAILEQGK